MTRFFLVALTVLTAGLLMLSACPVELPPDQVPPPQGSDAFLLQFDSCDELQDHVETAWLEALVASRYGGGWGWLEGDDDVADPAGDGDGPSDWSDTNVQEEGVDEPDIVETDGERIYVANRGELTVVDSWPPEDTAIVGRLALDTDDWYPRGMFLRDDRIVVYGYDWDAFEDDGGEGWHSTYATRVAIVDVSDPAAPALLREVLIEGWFVDARRIEGDVYTVVDTWMGVPYELYDLLWDEDLGLPEMDWEADEETQEAIREEARGILAPHVEAYLAEVEATSLLPRTREVTAGQVGDAEPLLACDEVYRPRDGARPSVLSVVHFDMSSGDVGGETSATGLMSEGWEVYASADNLYVAQTSWWWWWGWGDLDLQTHIHKFSLDAGRTRYLASGAVDGWVLNQFSFSEHDDHLRVATTDIDWWWGTEADDEATDPANNVFVLEQRGTALELTGELRGIAPNERIFAARFQGDRGFLVTFEQIDPLFTLDLSDPTDPRLVGELEITGFSSYLHPVDEDFLLAIGMEATPEGQTTGLAVSLFDVSDFADPQLADRWVLESDDWSWSEALWDHHAFTFHRGVLSFPAYTWTGGESFSGLVVLDVDLDEGLTQLGTVDRGDLVADSDCLYGEETACADWYWYAWMRRSVVVEDALYSLSDYGMKVNELEAPEVELARVLFWPAD